MHLVNKKNINKTKELINLKLGLLPINDNCSENFDKISKL